MLQQVSNKKVSCKERAFYNNLLLSESLKTKARGIRLLYKHMYVISIQIMYVHACINCTKIAL